MQPERDVVTPLRAVRLEPARASAIPSWCDAVVEAQDRWLVLGQGPTRAETDPEGYADDLALTSVDALLEAAAASSAAEPGSVLMRRTRPLRLLAVVHDLEADVTSRPEWTQQALDTLARLASRTTLRGIALPVLGPKRSDTDLESFGEMLADSLVVHGPARLRIALLLAPERAALVVRAMHETAPELTVRFDG